MAANTTFSKKHEEFVRGGMKDAKTADYKDVSAIAGIGEKCAEALATIGFTKAFHLLVRIYLFVCLFILFGFVNTAARILRNPLLCAIAWLTNPFLLMCTAGPVSDV